MLEFTEIYWWHWGIFVGSILVLVALDLGVFHKRAHVIRFREALGWTFVWFVLAMVFASHLTRLRGKDEALEFLTGYVVELSLSMDNVFVIALIFSYFRVPLLYQHRVLFWGILGALIMRGLMITLGAALVARFQVMLYIFGAFLIYSGIRMVFSKEEGVHPEQNPLIRLARKFFPVTGEFYGQQFLVQVKGQWSLTPLVLVLLMVETTDLIFALDSIPAIFGVTKKPFIIFTSNVFAILGLRSLYFVLAGALVYFRYLKIGLSFVLVFIGFKMLAVELRDFFGYMTSPEQEHAYTLWSLLIVAGIILVAITVSMVAGWLERRAGRIHGPDPADSQ